MMKLDRTWALALASALSLGCAGESDSDDGGMNSGNAEGNDDADGSGGDDGPDGDGTGGDEGNDQGEDGPDGDGTGNDDGNDDGNDESNDDGNDDGGTQSEACEGATMRDKPDDTAERGPWPVGVRTVDMGGLTVEVWYPAQPGSEASAEPEVYDIRVHLPASEQGKISDENNPWQPCDCYRDLPVDGEYGPYPAIVFVHGTAAWRTQSLRFMTHWASRGFVVLSADHPGLSLGDFLGMLSCGGSEPQNLAGNVNTMLAAIRGETQELGDLLPLIDSARIGMAGHSAGGGAISGFGSDAQVLVPMASGGVQAGAALQSTLVLGGTVDSVAQYSGQVNGFNSSPAPKRLVGLLGGGHLTFSEICSLKNTAGENLLTIAENAGVCNANLASFLFQCGPEVSPDAELWPIVEYTTAAAFEETLHCSPSAGDNFEGLQNKYTNVSQYLSE